MVNHLRTLLLNLAATAQPRPGEEYVPPEYVPVRLPVELAAARSALFGDSPDRTSMNLTLARLLSYLHTSRFHSDVFNYDSRISYATEKPVDVWTSLGTMVTTLSGSAAIGRAGRESFDQENTSFGLWEVTSTGTSTATVVITNGTTVSVPVNVYAIGDVIELPGSASSLVVPSGASGTWSVQILLPPQHDPLTAAEGFTHDFKLFRPKSDDDSEAAWYAAWIDAQTPTPIKVGALALALAARTNELR